MRTPAEIRNELEALAARRTEIWHGLAMGTREASAEIAELTQRIDELWIELRESKLLGRHGPRQEIIARARHLDRFERDYRRAYGLDRRPAVGGRR
jgi:hypothetical protein